MLLTAALSATLPQATALSTTTTTTTTTTTIPNRSPVRVVTSPLFTNHRAPPGRKHPECPERVTLATERLRSGADMAGCIDWASPAAEVDEAAREAALEAVLRVHDENYVYYLEALGQGGGGGLDADTYVAPLSFEIALLAQSAWMDATDYTIASGRPAFALVRPPGHHALRDRGMGFCLFNFCTVAAVRALDDPDNGVERVAMLDWDVHHGNGVADLVRDDPRIRYASLHEAGNFPSTPSMVSGAADDRGAHDNLLHIPMERGCEWSTFERLLRDEALPWLREFKPDLVVVSAGYDALELDPLARQNLQVGWDG
jgi:acetoin utilization deacetylase AcuC-like enzyme